MTLLRPGSPSLTYSFDLSNGHVQRIPEAFRVWRGDSQAYFDR